MSTALWQRKWAQRCGSENEHSVVAAKMSTALWQRKWAQCCGSENEHGVVAAKMSTALWQRKWAQRCDSENEHCVVTAKISTVLWQRKWAQRCDSENEHSVVTAIVLYWCYSADNDSGGTAVVTSRGQYWDNDVHISVSDGNWQRFDPGGGGGYLGQVLLGMCRWPLRTPHPIIVYSVANYRPHLSHFWANVIVISRTEFNAIRLLNIKTTAGTIFQPRVFLFLNFCLPEFSYPKHPENLRNHSSNTTKNVTPL